MSCAALISLSSLTQIKQSILKTLIEAVFISVIESNFIVVVSLLGPLMSPPVEFSLIHRPDCALHVLHAAEALVQGQVVSDSVLPGGRISTEEGEVGLEPVVNLIERQLSGRGLVYRLTDEGGVGEGRPDVSEPVELPVLAHLGLHVKTAGPVHFITSAEALPSSFCRLEPV